ncbi:MAG: hypothetical protein K8S99_01980 [Planctomycetes bacterium]|nr:hypothetical protein [Planctomycetota bacterium]
MARIRAASTTAYAVALVIFVVLFVFSLIAAILFYTKIAQANLAAETATASLKAVANDQQIDALKKNQAAKASGGTLVQRLQEELAAMQQIAAGTTSTSAASLKKDMATLGLSDQSSLLGELRRLQAEVASDVRRVSEAEGVAKTAQEEVLKAQKEKLDAATAFNTTITELKAKVDAMAAQDSRYETSIQDQGKTLTAQLNSVRDETKAAMTALRTTLDQKDKEIDALNKRIRDLQQRTTAKAAIDPSLEPKGRIVSIISERGLVYLDRGRTHHVQPGMTFLVGDRITGLTRDTKNELQGKAVVEVINVLDDSSVARIVQSTRGNTVVEGDLIYNAAYDANMHYKFVVYGEFDIDNTGSPSVGDRRRIETLISQAGGSVSPEMTYDTDFLVLAPEPKAPDPLRADEIDQTRITEHAEQTRRYKTWQGLLNQAKALSIPVLNQNRFLTLVGYYQR